MEVHSHDVDLGMFANMRVIKIIILDSEFASSRIGIHDEIYGILHRTR